MYTQKCSYFLFKPKVHIHSNPCKTCLLTRITKKKLNLEMMQKAREKEIIMYSNWYTVYFVDSFLIIKSKI